MKKKVSKRVGPKEVNSKNINRNQSVTKDTESNAIKRYGINVFYPGQYNSEGKSAIEIVNYVRYGSYSV